MRGIGSRKKSGIIYFLVVLLFTENINGTPNQNLHHLQQQQHQQQQQQHFPQEQQGQQGQHHPGGQHINNGNHHNMGQHHNGQPLPQHHGGNYGPPPPHHAQQQMHHPQQHHPQPQHHPGNQHGHHPQQQDGSQFGQIQPAEQQQQQQQQPGNGMLNPGQQDMSGGAGGQFKDGGGQFHGPNPSGYPEFPRLTPEFPRLITPEFLHHPNSLGSFDSPQFPNFPETYFSPVLPPNEHLHQIFSTLFSHCQSPHEGARLCLIESLLGAKEQLKFAHEGLAAHNRYRALHGVPDLKLDHKLSRDALAYAKVLAGRDSPVVHSDTTDRGENIYSARGYKMTGSLPVDGWYSEIALYNFSNPELDFGKNAHFTQLVWKDTERVGMAWAKRKKNGEIMVVAQYQPSGNDADVLKENVLEPKKVEKKWEEGDK